jgi:hypothetical protein
MLQFYIPEVLGVEQVQDEVDLVSEQHLRRFEARLKSENKE